MIPVPSSYRVYLSTGVTDMRRGMPSLSLQVQEALGRDPHAVNRRRIGTPYWSGPLGPDRDHAAFLTGDRAC